MQRKKKEIPMSKTKAVDSTILFSKTAPLKLFFIAAVPGAISMFASALYQTIDGVFVGRFLGQTAFAAVNLAMPFVIINFFLADLIGVGSAVPISVCLGKKQEREANNIFTCACLMIVGAGAVIGGILFAAAPLLIRLMGGGRRVRRPGGAVSAGICDLFAVYHHHLCNG